MSASLHTSGHTSATFSLGPDAGSSASHATSNHVIPIPPPHNYSLYPTMSDSETLDALQTRHRKEQRDLIARTTQKKKGASKKTRKGVNEECERLERELKERQEREVAEVNGETSTQEPEESDSDEHEDVANGVANLHITNTTPSSPPTTTPTPSQTKKPHRAKTRLAARAAHRATLIATAEAEALNAPNPRATERTAMSTQLQNRALTLHEIRADGHCMYAAVADQLVTRGLGLEPKIRLEERDSVGGEEEGFRTVRHAAASYIEAHPQDYQGFTEDPIPEHIRKIRETGEWGGHIELQALAAAYGVRICVLHSDGRVDTIVPSAGDQEDKEKDRDIGEVWLGYFRHSHGLGEHYNSLRKI